MTTQWTYAADQLAPLLATGRLSWESIRHIVSVWGVDAKHKHTTGMQADLCWRISDGADAYIRSQKWAERKVRVAVRPLLHEGSSKAEIEEAAGRAAEGSTLEWPDIYPILREEMFRARRG